MAYPKLRVLVIDDEPIICEYFATVLARLGPVEVVACCSFADGIAKSDPDELDCVLLDMEFPGEGLSGPDSIRTLIAHWRRLGRGSVPIIAFSGANGERRQAALSAGAFAFVLKPIESPKAIYNLLVEAASEHRSKRSAAPALEANKRIAEQIAGAKHDSVHEDALPARRGRASVVLLAIMALTLSAWFAGGEMRGRSLGGAEKGVLEPIYEEKATNTRQLAVVPNLDARIADLRSRPTLATVSAIDREPPVAERRAEVLALLGPLTESENKSIRLTAANAARRWE